MPVTVISKPGTQSDPGIVREQFEALTYCLNAWGPAVFMAYFMWILTKNSNEQGTRYVPFKLNRIQEHLIGELTNRNLLLKARQMGGTTFTMLKQLLLPAVTQQGFRGLFVSQKQFYANQHFLILDRARRLFAMQQPGAGPEVNALADSLNKHLLKRRLANRRELMFENLDSLVVVDSAENKEAGQGFTVNGFVGSEFSRWPGDPAETLANIRGSLAPNATETLECTANGAQGPFYEMVNQALSKESIYRLHFYEWWWTDEYQEALEADKRVELINDLSRIAELVQEEKATKIRNEALSDREREEFFIRDYAHLTLMQIAWRRTQISANPVAFKENYPEDEISCFLSEGNSFFNAEIIHQRNKELAKFTPYKTGRNGEAILFWRPRPKVRYLIGADVAEGLSIDEQGTKLDYNAAMVIDLATGEQVAQYFGRERPDEYAKDLAELGRMYNDAVIAVERNSFGLAALISLETTELYPNIYQHPHIEGIDTAAVGEKMGFPTNKQTRPIALSFLQTWVEENPSLIWSRTFCHQAASFIRAKNGKPQAAPGAHDDMVMGNAIALAARAYLMGMWVPIRPLPSVDDDGGY